MKILYIYWLVLSAYFTIIVIIDEKITFLTLPGALVIFSSTIERIVIITTYFSTLENAKFGCSHYLLKLLVKILN